VTQLSASVIVATYRRAERLKCCLTSLASQVTLPDEVIVVWQGDDVETKELAEQFAGAVPFKLKAVHRSEPGIVPAENAGLDAADGEIILLIDDDAIAPSEWLRRHLAHYEDPSVGAVGGGCQNFHSDGSPAKVVAPRRIGELTWFGQFRGNMSDHSPEWRARGPILVSNLLGGNMSLRRSCFARFESAMKPYWELFEADACLQVSRRGFRVLFDFGNPISHYPVHRITNPERLTDRFRVFNLAYNHAFILSKHSPWWLRVPRLLYLILVGCAARPGFLGLLVAWSRRGELPKQLSTFRACLRCHLSGWLDGSKCRDLRIRPPAAGAQTPETSNILLSSGLR